MWIFRAVKQNTRNICSSDYCGYQGRFIWDHKFIRGSSCVRLLLIWFIVLHLHGISSCDGLNASQVPTSNSRQEYQTEAGFMRRSTRRSHGILQGLPVNTSDAENDEYMDIAPYRIWRDHCGCWNSTADGEHREVECKCNGTKMTALSSNLPFDVYRITIADARNFTTLSNDQLLPYNGSLREIVLSELPLFREIQDGSFDGMGNLDTVYIHDAPSLIQLSNDVFKGYLPKLKIIRIHHTSLGVAPKLSQLSTDNLLNAVDLENNKIRTIELGWVENLQVDHLALSYNNLEEIGPRAFNGATIATLTLKGNRQLRTLHSDAFLGIHSLRHLDLSETAITLLPTAGLDHIEKLRLENVLTLTVIPSIYHFQDLKEAWMTFPYHCCAFEFPETHDPIGTANYNDFLKRMEKIFCAGESDKVKSANVEDASNGRNRRSLIEGRKQPRYFYKSEQNQAIEIANTTPSTSQHNRHNMKRNRRRNVSPWSSSRSVRGIVETNGEKNHSKNLENPFQYPWPSTVNNTVTLIPPYDEFDPFIFDPDKTFGSALDPNNVEREKIRVPHNWETHTHTHDSFGRQGESSDESGSFHDSVNAPPPIVKLCGNITVKIAHIVQCNPLPDAFSPCEDIMGNMWLRCGVWVVVSLALIGNTAVLVVLLFAPGKMNVQRFLMANLSFADLCMGVYLLMVATEDLISLGAYFNYAIQWQLGWGCQIAGFFTVFASELSVYTLAVITGERWYALTRAIHLTKRLTITGAAQLMSIGWILAITLSVLPLSGVSSYSKTSICLPMEASTGGAQAYLAFLLLFNGVAFTLVACAYFQMYKAVAGHNSGGAGTSATHAADAAVAKKMSLLVFTDFVCWAPIAFFGLTAVSGNPLIGVTDSKILLVFFYPLNACCNPYLYAILTKQYRRDLLLLLSRHGLCTKRAARYKTGQTGSTNNTMHTMQTILRLGSVAETKVLTNGGHNSSMTSIPGIGHSQHSIHDTSQGGLNLVGNNGRVEGGFGGDYNKKEGGSVLPIKKIKLVDINSCMSRNDKDEDEDDHGIEERLLAETSFISVPVPVPVVSSTESKPNINWHPRTHTGDDERILIKFRLDTVESCGDAEDESSDSTPICSSDFIQK